MCSNEVRYGTGCLLWSDANLPVIGGPTGLMFCCDDCTGRIFSDDSWKSPHPPSFAGPASVTREVVREANRAGIVAACISRSLLQEEARALGRSLAQEVWTRGADNVTESALKTWNHPATNRDANNNSKDLNAKDQDGATALMQAAGMNSSDLDSLLFQYEKVSANHGEVSARMMSGDAGFADNYDKHMDLYRSLPLRVTNELIATLISSRDVPWSTPISAVPP